ncbi:M24 family metallopeptidase [Streptomyces sp. NPDC048603]|uniref:M24 family metallopeptidase n=1 Tax=Streptomyces sp. NPDC048603 TaxID=3365577 RepID=UPI00371FBE85
MAVPDRMDERLRVLRLLEAQRMAQTVFAEAALGGAVVPGRTECEAGDRIRDVARKVFGSVAGRPGRIVRSGPHTVLPSGEEPPDRVIGVDDLVVVDLGPLLAWHETDFARTLVLGEDEGRHQLVEDLARVGAAAREAFLGEERITGRQLHSAIQALAAGAGRTLGTWQAGRICGQAPAAGASGTKPDSFIGPDNHRPLRRTDGEGRQAHWILEIRLVDDGRGFGGSFKQLLDLV